MFGGPRADIVSVNILRKWEKHHDQHILVTLAEGFHAMFQKQPALVKRRLVL